MKIEAKTANRGIAQARWSRKLISENRTNNSMRSGPIPSPMRLLMRRKLAEAVGAHRTRCQMLNGRRDRREPKDVQSVANEKQRPGDPEVGCEKTQPPRGNGNEPGDCGKLRIPGSITILFPIRSGRTSRRRILPHSRRLAGATPENYPSSECRPQSFSIKIAGVQRARP